MESPENSNDIIVQITECKEPDETNVSTKLNEKTEDNENKNTNNLLEINTKIKNYIKFLRVMSTLKLYKEDNQPVEIIEGVYIGSVGAASNKEGLADRKITHIISAGIGLKQYYPEDFTYMSLQLLDSPEVEINKYFEETGLFISECLSANGRVFVHCHAGISRSSTIIISYLIKYHQMSFEVALELARSKRAKINPNQGFVKQLKDYEKDVFKC